MFYPPIRRVVTGHSPSGKAIIDSDTLLAPYDPLFADCSRGTADKLAFTTIWRTASSPAKVDGPWTDFNGSQIPLADSVGTIIRIVDFPPGPGFMHRTVSIDFGVVLAGEVVLELDNGIKTTLKKDDIVVQRSTIHAWSNLTPEPARMLFAMLPAEPVKIGNQVLEATVIPSPFGASSSTPNGSSARNAPS
ncbi:cupin domain-containing protein [Blastomyces gilchristii SLH14081]|uniref:Cupin domain-containing protein n=1 Tax=Blastomyces gilchristii (strain SLH14081) TaxID=559298 RepID=A0A179UBZ4_BLAGS|nr:cupin domain-containing protein [Blastomyces gilchristii SLH14081]OAT04809.1 cupin domain-containing protein [Blastomyces gilchristii SLH14081]